MDDFDKKVLGSILAGIALLFALAYWATVERCNQQAVSFEDHEYGFFSGCMVKHEGKWLPLENIRGFD